MKLAAPGQGAAGGADQNQKSPLSDSTSVLRPQAARLDDIIRAEVRALWWRMRRQHGVELPAERGIILLQGGRR